MGIGLVAQTDQQRQTPPPGQAEYQAAVQIADLDTRIKELRRIKAAYPNSVIASRIDTQLLTAVAKNADSFEKLLSSQKEIIAQAKPAERIGLVYSAAQQIVGHESLDSFPKQDLLKAIQGYRAEAMELIVNPEVKARYSETIITNFKYAFEIPLAKAMLVSGDSKAALATIEEYGKTRPYIEPYYNVLGDIYVDQKRDREALDAFISAAVIGNSDAKEKARKVFARINGDAANFDEELERRQTQSFHPPAFKIPADWKGKTVLAELFTGSECPPCVAADMAFDAFLETYPAKYLAILEYHLPIPGPDPMMNLASKKRADFYSVNGTPTVVVDGATKVPAGGYMAHTRDSFDRVKKEIDVAMEATSEITLKATARLDGDNVHVDCEFSKVIENADYQIVLVQAEVEHKGGNGIIFHKMVARDIETVKPSDKASVTFNIPESEKAADAHLTELETSRKARQPDWKWPSRQNKIDRAKLKAIVFVQDKETKLVYNAFVTDVIAN
jgi:thiol-disulfide isomerase/thioredoxin